MPSTARETKGQSLPRTPIGNVSAFVVAGSDRIEEYHATGVLTSSGKVAARWTHEFGAARAICHVCHNGGGNPQEVVRLSTIRFWWKKKKLLRSPAQA